MQRRFRRALLLAFSVSIAVVALARAGQQPSGPARGRGAQPAAPVPPLFLPDEAYIRWPLLPSEAKYGSLKGDHIKAMVKEVTAISKKSRDDGNQYWGRITGTPYDVQSQQWALGHFRRVGLEQIRTQPIDLAPQWMPASWEGSVQGGGKTVALKTLFPIFGSRATPPGGLELEPVWVGFGTGADFLGRDVKGKAAFIYSIPTPGGRNFSARWNGAVERAEQLGAAAVVVVMGVPGNITSQPAGEGAGGESPVPEFTVGLADGTAVREMLEQRLAPKVRLRMTVNRTTGLKTANVWGVLPGMTDENILIMAHADAFFEGALDNASGMAGLVALAEYYAAIPKAQRRRTLTFLITPGHHAGDPGTRWVHDNRDTVLAKTALIINCEHFSQTQTYWLGSNLMPSNTVSARRWYVGGSDRLKALIAKSFMTFGVAIYSRPEDRPGGSLSILFPDAPSVHVIDHIYYHTDMDVAELVPDTGLEAVARAFAKIIDDVNTLDIKDLRTAPGTR